MPEWRPFAALTDAELSEVDIALDHRRAEAEPGYMGGPGNAYVWKDVADRLLDAAHDEHQRRGIAHERR